MSKILDVSLVRFAYTKMGVFGKISIGDTSFYTVENPWELNAEDISCIPLGTYRGELYNSPTPNRGRVWQLLGVPNRTFVQIHKGNTSDDVEGCIVVGSGLGYISGKWAVVSSKTAFNKFMDLTKGYDEIRLTISIGAE